jgi:hypothetical protein
MEHNIDLIKQIREAYAKEEGYKSFASMALNVNIVPRDITEIAKRYAEGMIAALQSRCDRYEKALSTIKDAPVPVTRNDLDFWISAARATANEALNREGKEWWQELSIENMPQYVKITGVGCSIIQNSIVKVEGSGMFDDPMFDNMGEPYVLLRDKHFEIRGLTRMNCKNVVPATAADYEAYLQTLTVK